MLFVLLPVPVPVATAVRRARATSVPTTLGLPGLRAAAPPASIGSRPTGP
ncbi:hypothetical protein [Kitasatospora sp. NPDC094015]